MKKIICVLSLLSLLSSVSYARSGTLFKTYSGNEVQCNNWGWVMMRQTYWPDVVCAPLQVKTHNGEVLSVATTDVCGGTAIATYAYKEGDTEISFQGCLN